jgi:hypothetical protein
LKQIFTQGAGGSKRNDKEETPDEMKRYLLQLVKHIPRAFEIPSFFSM